jgi:DeoR family fructose operon transcriptional repressor
MFAEERRALIEELLHKQSSVKVQELCDKFDVSSSTIRRDLSELEQEGIIRRTHGGAVLADRTKFEPSFREKRGEHLAEKKQIGKKAVDFINEGETIILDAGTTTTQLAENLTNFSNLTVVTNALNIAQTLAQGANEVISVGGQLKKKTLALVGPLTENSLEQLAADKVFLGINTISLAEGLTTPDLVEAQIKKTMIGRAKEVIVIADHTKFEAETFVKVADLNMVDRLITDRQINRDILKKYRQKVEIVVAD